MREPIIRDAGQGTAALIFPPHPDNEAMGYSPDVWVVGMKTRIDGVEYGLIYQMTNEPVGVLLDHMRVQFLADLEKAA